MGTWLLVCCCAKAMSSLRKRSLSAKCPRPARPCFVGAAARALERGRLRLLSVALVRGEDAEEAASLPRAARRDVEKEGIPSAVLKLETPPYICTAWMR